MAIINYYLDPAGAVIIDTADSVAQSLLSRWPNGEGVPKGLRIYRGDVADCNDITDAAFTDITVLTAPSDDTYNCVVVPGEIGTILAVIAIVISVASVLLTPSISVPANANRNQQSPNNAFGARSNQARINQRSADIRGKQARCYPDLLQVPYRRFREGIEYEYVYAQIGEGYYAYNTIKDGDTLYDRLGGKLAIYGPDTSPLSGTPEFTINGAPTETLYTVVQSNEIDGATLPATDKSEGFGAPYKIYSTGIVEITSGDVDFTDFITVGDNAQLRDFNVFVPLSGGEPGELTAESIDGSYLVIAVTATELTLDVSAVAAWADIDVAGQVMPTTMYFYDTSGTYFYSPPVEPATRPVTFLSSVSSSTDGAIVGPINVTGYDQFLVNVVAQSGIYKDLNGTIEPASAVYTVTIYELDGSDVRTGISTDVSGLVVSRDGDPTNFTGSSLQAVIPYSRAEITCQRVSATVPDSPVDEIKWRDLYLLDNVVSVDTSYATTIHAEIRATETALRVKERKLNLAVTRKVAAYNGDGTFAATESTITDLFAPVIASIWRDPLFGRGEDDEVNWQNLFDTQAAMITYYGESNPCRVGYTFDSDKITAEDAIKLICNAVNVIPYRIGSVLNFWFEGPQTQSSMFFGHRFKHPGSENRSRTFGPTDDKTGVELTYFDELTESFEIVRRGDSINPLKIELSGCITARGAQIRADREWNKLRYSRVQTQFDATAIGRMAVPGMRVDVVDNTRRAPYNGEIRDVSGLTVTISQPIELATPTDYSIVLTRSDGSLESIGIASQPSADKLVLASAPSEPVRVSRLADRTVYSIGTDDMMTKIAMLIREITPRDYNKVGIAAINYDPRYYSEDN